MKAAKQDATHVARVGRLFLEGSREVLGPRHPDTLTSVSNLGELLWSPYRQGKLEEEIGKVDGEG